MRIGSKLILVLLLAALPVSAAAFGNGKNEVRIGYGDPMFETLCFHNSPHRTSSSFYSIPSFGIYSEKSGHQYSGHLFAEYMRALSDVWYVGLGVDWEKVSWNVDSFSADGLYIKTEPFYFTNLNFIASVKANWVRREHFKMYSSIGFGMNVNNGNEIDYKDRTRIFSPALNLCLVGGRYDWDNFFVGLDIGGLSALNNGQEVFMVFSRIFSISAGIKF